MTTKTANKPAENKAKAKPNPMETGIITFARSFQISEGLFYGVAKVKTSDGVVGNTRIPIEVTEQGVRGQSSEYEAKNPGESNPQLVETCIVPVGCHSAEIDFGVRVLANSIKPYACNSKSVSTLYQELAETYLEAGGYAVLARMYIRNIANARFAWRNRFQSDKMEVRIKFDNEELVFDPLLLGLKVNDDFEELSSALIRGNKETLQLFIERVVQGLTEPTSPFGFRVIWSAEMLAGQEVFPSQEYLRTDKKADKDKLKTTRVYAKLPAYYRGKEILQASLHSQKINAAIRFIDVWYGQDLNVGDAIPVNPYGGIQETGEVLRKPKTKSLYDIRANEKQLFEDAKMASSIDKGGDAHFVMANLVRGGLFNHRTKDKGSK